MKLGLLTDIHEHVEPLRAALDRLRAERVDRIVVIGDLVQMGEELDETCRLLLEAGAVGVWGNHDYGLCVDPPDEFRLRYAPAVFELMGRLRPRLEIDGCLFTHVEPWLNAESLFDLWYFDGPPDEHGKLERIFRASDCRVMFGGHYHKWLLVTPEGITAWQGDEPIRLARGRFFVVIAALCDGHFATYDTATSQLVPMGV